MSVKLPFSFPGLSYHDRSFGRQKRDLTIPFLQRMSIESATCVLDVGCGAGQTLRIVEELNPSTPLIGVDADGAALKHGRSANGRIVFVKGKGEQLPIADGSVSHIISRVSINYMHQENALREMVRILKPGGRMVVSFIGLGYTLRQAVCPDQVGWRQRIGNLKDLFVGVWLQIFGVQPNRHTFWGRSVPFTSMWRLRRQLRDLQCTMMWIEHEAKYLGIQTVFWVVIEKTALE